MKPDWKDAPEWAECLLRTNEGEWWWLENTPSYFLNFEGDIEWQVQGKTDRAGDSFVRYHPCYEMRPENRPIITRFAQRLKRIGVDVELVLNYPWVYLTRVNGVPVTELFMANHGFTAFFVATVERWSDRRKVFAKVRELLSSA